jgi:two-component system sensor histidine kinase PilS (NtrC family)
MGGYNLLNYLLLIRLVIYAFVFLIITVFNIVFEGPAQKELLLNLMLSVSFFSIFSFISSIQFKKFAFYIQPIFDTIVLTLLVFSTGFLGSPFIIFYAIIIFYMGFLEGYKGGMFELIILPVIFIIFYIYFKDEYHLVLTNQKLYYLIMQYIIVFIIIMILSIYLHLSYKNKAIEKEYLEDRFRSLKNLHENILQTINIGIILLNDTNTIISCNKAAEYIIEQEESKIIGKKITDFFNISKENEDITKLEDKFIGYKYQNFSSELNDLTGKLLIFQDVTEKELLKEELNKQQKLATLGQFSSVIAHEIKNPLGAIKGSFQLIKKQIPEDNKLVNIVDRELHRLDLVLNNLLYVSKPAFKEESKILINEVLDDFINSLETYKVFEEIKCNIKIDEKIYVIISNYEFKQLLWNLFVNTYEAKNNAHIDIHIYSKNDFIYLEYLDNGKGIAPEILKDVIQPFFTTKRSGTGLGLFVIRTICDKYKIKYKIFSNSEVDGFKIQFKFNKVEV